MNKTLCALALSITALTGGCNPPTVVQPEGGNTIELIPSRCVEVKSIVRAVGPKWSLKCMDAKWDLTCVDICGKDIFYYNTHHSNHWHNYDIVRK